MAKFDTCSVLMVRAGLDQLSQRGTHDDEIRGSDSSFLIFRQVLLEHFDVELRVGLGGVHKLNQCAHVWQIQASALLD